MNGEGPAILYVVSKIKPGFASCKTSPLTSIMISILSLWVPDLCSANVQCFLSPLPVWDETCLINICWNRESQMNTQMLPPIEWIFNIMIANCRIPALSSEKVGVVWGVRRKEQLPPYSVLWPAICNQWMCNEPLGFMHPKYQRVKKTIATHQKACPSVIAW